MIARGIYYCCVGYFIACSLKFIDVATSTTEVGGPSGVTIVDALFTYDCFFSFL